MNRNYGAIVFKTKAVLCLLLTANLSIWGLGCGQVGYSLLGEVVIPLTADHELTEALKGSEFEGATAVAVNPGTQTFRLIFPDSERELSGTYINKQTGAELTSVTLATPTQTATLQLGPGQRVTQITSTLGSTWARPAEWDQAASTYAAAPAAPSAPSAPSAPAAAREISSDASGYLEANAQLLELARQLDEQRGSSIDKTDQSSLVWAAGALLHLVFGGGGIAATLIFIFQVISIISLLI